MVDPYLVMGVQSNIKSCFRGPKSKINKKVIKENLTRALELVEGRKGWWGAPKLIVFPEFFIQGLAMDRPIKDWVAMSVTVPGEETDVIAATAKRLGSYISACVYEYDPNFPKRYWDTSFIIDPRGKIILKYRQHYGVSVKTIKWFTERPERINLKLPNMQIKRLPEGMSSVAALEAGLVDAIGSFDPQPRKKIVPLFKDPKQEEIKYYKRTKIFPIMHALAIKNEILERSPWVAQSIMQAMQKSKQIAYETRDKLAPQNGSINIWNDGLRDQYEVFGEDPFPYGLDVNMHTLETWASYLRKQGYITKKPDIRSMFAKGTEQVTKGW